MIDGVKIIEEYESFKAVFPEWAGIACGITGLMCLLCLAIGLICDLMNHDAGVPLFLAMVFLVAMIVLLILGGVLHDVVPDGVYWEVEIDWEVVDWGKANALYDFWIEDGKIYIRGKEPG